MRRPAGGVCADSASPIASHPVRLRSVFFLHFFGSVAPRLHRLRGATLRGFRRRQRPAGSGDPGSGPASPDLGVSPGQYIHGRLGMKMCGLTDSDVAAVVPPAS